MTVGVLVITHEEVGKALLDAAVNMLGLCPLATETLTVQRDVDPETLVQRARVALAGLDTGDGVLVLTDMYGSTPSNIACRLFENGQVEVVSGINLSMLVRVLNYPSLSLHELTEKALSGGHEGIMACMAPER